MKLVFPTNENQGYLSKRGAHFGKAKFYTVVTIENGDIKDVEGIENPGHKSGSCGNAVTNILSLKPDALIVGGIGARPAEGFANAGLDVYFDSESKTIKESLKAFLDGKLQKLEGKGTCNHK